MVASAILLAASGARAARAEPRPVSLVLAPSNLGLRPENGEQPGTWQAPRVLMEAGLRESLAAHEVLRLERPVYEFEAQHHTRIRNGQTIRAFSLALSQKVQDILRAGRFPVVIGGDCSILLGCLLGARVAGGRGLLHVDGHSDFAQAKNHATPSTLGAAAGMDLALASGRGEPMLTTWPDIGTPLAEDADIVQIGERDRDTPSFLQFYGDIVKSEITQLTVQDMHTGGIAAGAGKALARLETRGLERVWLHVDLDVLDQAVMPAVDSPGSPGFDYAELAELVGRLVASGRVVGANFAIYDPDRDPGAKHAPDLVACIAKGIGRRAAQAATS